MIYMGETSIFRKYYDAHQISKSVNILDVARLEYPNKNVIPIKCISSFLEPVEGWDRGVRNASTEIERCHYCMAQLKKNFPDYNVGEKATEPMAKNIQCQNCYIYCCKKYMRGNGAMKLTKSMIKAGKLK